LEDELYGWILSRLNELKGSETDRFLKFLAIINTFLEEKRLRRIIIVGGFAAEIYSGRSYRTGDVDIIVEGDAELVRKTLSKVSDLGSRIMLPRIREISEKGIDIVSNVCDRKREPRRLVIDGKYSVYIIPAEEFILTYLEGWKVCDSTEDKMKAVLVYCAQKETIDKDYLEKEAKSNDVYDYYLKLKEYC